MINKDRDPSPRYAGMLSFGGNVRRPIKLLLLPAAAVALGGLVVLALPARPTDDFTIYGNVELRRISLAFEKGGRIVEMLSEEGEHVHEGQVLARQDKSALELNEQQAAARLAALEQVVLRLKNGTRPEELAQARARVESARAQADFAERQYRRMETLAGKERAVSQQDRESSRSARDMAAASLEEAKKSLELLEIGPRAEDIAQAEAEAEAARASLASIRRDIEQSELKAPRDALVRSRLLEPGDMASAQRPAFQLLVAHPKWIRAYVPEPRLGRIRPGDRAEVLSDSFPEHPVPGRVGYISSVAEFTPKSVQTEELRTALVYEVRIIVEDPDNTLRLGMPVTVRLLPDGAEQHS